MLSGGGTGELLISDVFILRKDVLSLTSNRKVHRDVKRNHGHFKEMRSLKQRFPETGEEGRTSYAFFPFKQ